MVESRLDFKTQVSQIRLVERRLRKRRDDTASWRDSAASIDHRISACKPARSATSGWERAVELLPQVICVVNIHGEITWTNRADRTLAQWPSAQTIDNTLHRLLHPRCIDVRCCVGHAWAKVVLALSHTSALDFDLDDGIPNRIYRVRVSVIARDYLVTQTNQVPFAVVTLEDVTEIRQKEIALKRSFDELQERIKHDAMKQAKIQEAERQRIALDLHDDIGQSLSVIRMGCESVSRLLTTGNVAQANDELNMMAPLIKDASKRVRQIAFDLRPPVFDIGIIAALTGLVRQFQLFLPNTKLECRIEIEEQDIAQDTKLSVYRIAQEAFNNVLKHAAAAQVCVGLRKVNNELQLVITDDGKGFDPRTMLSIEGREGGVGLGSMQERALMSGGRLLIESVAGAGTKILASWPCRARSKRHVRGAVAKNETVSMPRQTSKQKSANYQSR